MSWAAGRRLIILLIVGAIAVAFLTVVLISALYKTPSCTDGVQNQNEAGVDCGGPCAYLCTALEQAPTVLFTKVLQNNDGRTDIIASVENKNVNAAAKNVPYRIVLYGEEQSSLGELTGTIDLPPRTTMLVYLPGVAAGNQKIVSAFLDIAASAPQWFVLTVDSRVVPMVANTTQSGTSETPRIEAVLTNPSTSALSNVQVIVLVHDVRKTVIAASKTIVPTIPAQGQAVATFTWNNAFPSVPASIEVVPIVPLPAQAGLP